MKKINVRHHPDPGRQTFNFEKCIQNEDFQSNAYLGKHCILELYECDHQKLNDELFVRSILTSAAKIAGAKMLNLITHRFKPHGVTGIALLAESHISIHTWPESGYAAIDVFTCGRYTVPEKACKVMAREFCAEKYSFKTVFRNTPSELQEIKRVPEHI